MCLQNFLYQQNSSLFLEEITILKHPRYLLMYSLIVAVKTLNQIQGQSRDKTDMLSDVH